MIKKDIKKYLEQTYILFNCFLVCFFGVIIVIII